MRTLDAVWRIPDHDDPPSVEANSTLALGRLNSEAHQHGSIDPILSVAPYLEVDVVGEIEGLRAWRWQAVEHCPSPQTARSRSQRGDRPPLAPGSRSPASRIRSRSLVAASEAAGKNASTLES